MEDEGAQVAAGAPAAEQARVEIGQVHHVKQEMSPSGASTSTSNPPSALASTTASAATPDAGGNLPDPEDFMFGFLDVGSDGGSEVAGAASPALWSPPPLPEPMSELMADRLVARVCLKICHCCDKPRTPGHRWCPTHKKVYDCLVRDITSKKKTHPEAFKTEMASHQLTMKDPVLSAQKVLQFEADNPIVVKGKKRGTFDHITFHERFSKKTYSTNEIVGKKMDFIEYSRKMERTRGWTVGQSRAKWNWHLAQQGAQIDMRGEEPGFEQRILITKGDYSKVGTMSVEEKAIEIVSRRHKSIAAEAWKEALENLGTGHGNTASSFHADTAAAFGNSSAVSAFTARGSQPNMLEAAHVAQVALDAHAAGAGNGGAQPAPNTAGGGHAAQAQAMLESPSKGAAVAVEDIANLRLPTYRKWESQAMVVRKKLGTDYAAGALLLAQDHVT